MLNNNIEKIIGWYDEVADHFLCVECFCKLKNLKKKNYEAMADFLKIKFQKEKSYKAPYKPIEEKYLEENVYTCDECGREQEIQKEFNETLEPKEKGRVPKWVWVVGGIVIVVILGSWGWKKEAQNIEEQVPTLQDIKMQVAIDAIEQYTIAKKHGSAIDACVSAGLASAALLQAKDETNYQKMKEIERAECAGAGLPR